MNKGIIKRIKRALESNMSLAYAKHKEGHHPLSGMCYIASEAYYHIEGKKLGMRPKRAKYKGMSHWWLEDKGGNVLDITKEQFDFEFPYKIGKFSSFLTKYPSKRAKKIIADVAQWQRH